MNAEQPPSPTPASYPRRILLCATGMSPQIVTETLYALAVRPLAGQPPWVPTEMHLITTARGADHARLNLLAGDAWFASLCKDYQLPQIAFGPRHIHLIDGADGAPLQDIRTPQDNEAAADQIAGLVSRFAADTGAQLHVSLAGGRKTMGYYLGYALSLYGRPQDRLSHVLVSEPYESHPGFYYPTPYERVIHSRDANPVAMDCAAATVQLAEIPFVRLRDGLPERLLTGRASFTATVDAANRAQGRPQLALLPDILCVRVNGLEVKLGSAEFALLLWLARRARSEDPEVDWQDARAVSGEFLPLLPQIFGPLGSEVERIETALRPTLAQQDAKGLANYFQVQMSRLNKTLRDELGEPLARRCMIERVGARGQSRYRLPADIELLL